MVIVAGDVIVEPQQRESYLAGSRSIVEHSRRAVGCLDCAPGADLIDPGRVNLFERWESQELLETYRRSAPSDEHLPVMLSVSAAEYDIADERPLFGEATAWPGGAECHDR